MPKQIPLTQGQIAIVDDEDYDYLNQWKWNADWIEHTKSFRARRHSFLKTLYMHRIVMNAPEHMQVDHIDHDTLNNQKSNLRLVTSSQNMMNRRIQSNNTTGYTGVYKEKKKFCAKINKDGKEIYLGHFNSIDEALEARKKAAEDIHGNYRLSQA